MSVTLTDTEYARLQTELRELSHYRTTTRELEQSLAGAKLDRSLWDSTNRKLHEQVANLTRLNDEQAALIRDRNTGAGLYKAETASLKERIANMENEKRDGLRELDNLRGKSGHWRQLYQQTQTQYVKLHGDWTELKRRHDKKCMELTALETRARVDATRAAVEQRQGISVLAPGPTPHSTTVVGEWDDKTQRYVGRPITTLPTTVDISRRRYVVTVYDRSGVVTIKTMEKLPEGL